MSIKSFAEFTHDERLDRFAEVIVKIGLALRRGQELIIGAPVETVALVRLITKHAYQAGASHVQPVYSDGACTVARHMHAMDESFDVAPGWLFKGMAQAYRNGAARLAIAGDDPDLLAGHDIERIARADKARSKAARSVKKLLMGFQVNWAVVSYATEAWATKVFPDCPPEVAVEKLWDAIFAVSRVDTPDPVAAWTAHNEALRERVGWLNEKKFAALHFTGPGTDLRVGLADDNIWGGGSETAGNGVTCNPNLPTEEVWAAPHNQRTEGYVSGTKPLSYNGSLIDGIHVRFKRGRVVEAFAAKAQDVLRKMIATDKGAGRLGEVALVPNSNPIAQTGIPTFYETLFDENAASHLALGACYPTNIRGGERMKKRERSARGGNDSGIHVDWMIGSGEIDVDGIDASGKAEPVMRKGEWV